MRFDRLDLNLLVAFDALMEERSVSTSAHRLNLSQSAMSGALARLRQYFDDELLVPTGRSMAPTQMGLELAGHVRQALTLIRSTITTPNIFDPATTERIFSIMTSDYVYDVLLCDLIKNISNLYPNIKFRLIMSEISAHERFMRGEIDLFITLEEFLSQDHPAKFLFEDELAVVAWAENPNVRHTLSLQQFENMVHVDVTFGESLARAFSERMLSKIEVTRRIELQVHTFSAVPNAIVGTERIATMNRRHAIYFASHFPLKVYPIPLSTPRLREAIQWHSMRKNDQGLQWLRNQIMASTQSLETLPTHL